MSPSPAGDSVSLPSESTPSTAPSVSPIVTSDDPHDCDVMQTFDGIILRAKDLFRVDGDPWMWNEKHRGRLIVWILAELKAADSRKLLEPAPVWWTQRHDDYIAACVNDTSGRVTTDFRVAYSCKLAEEYETVPEALVFFQLHRRIDVHNQLRREALFPYVPNPPRELPRFKSRGFRPRSSVQRRDDRVLKGRRRKERCIRNALIRTEALTRRAGLHLYRPRAYFVSRYVRRRQYHVSRHLAPGFSDTLEQLLAARRRPLFSVRSEISTRRAELQLYEPRTYYVSRHQRRPEYHVTRTLHPDFLQHLKHLLATRWSTLNPDEESLRDIATRRSRSTPVGVAVRDGVRGSFLVPRKIIVLPARTSHSYRFSSTCLHGGHFPSSSTLSLETSTGFTRVYPFSAKSQSGSQDGPGGGNDGGVYFSPDDRRPSSAFQASEVSCSATL